MSESNIHIERCVLRIRRRSGWSWGTDPDALVRAATRALPALLQRHLTRGALPADLDERTDAIAVDTIKLTIPVTLAELAALGDVELGAMSAATAHVEHALAHGLAHAMRDAQVQTHASGSPAPEPANEQPTSSPGAVAGEAAAILGMLERWSRSGELVTALAAFSGRLVTELRRALISAAASGSPVHQLLGEAEVADTIAAIDAAHQSHGVLDEHRQWLVAFAAALGGNAGATTFERAVVIASRAVEQLRSSRVARRPESIAPADAPEQTTSPTSPVSTARETAAAPFQVAIRATRDVEIACALPFLAMIPLARIGWLQTLDAVMTALDARPALPAIATALAYKMLQPAARGWRHASPTSTAAAAFAALEMTPASTVYHHLATFDRELARPLDATVTAALREGHVRGSPLLLQRGDTGYHVLESHGLFAFAWAREVHELDVPLDEIVLVPAHSASAPVLDRLDLTNRRFITDAPAVRGEPWRELPRGLRTNDTEAPPAKLIALAHQLDTLAGLAAELDGEIGVRPGLPRGASELLERSLTLAALLALADLSWALFREREPATPVLALTRFSDLSARVTFGSEVVRVQLPLGRRHADLFAHHYTGEVHGVPWLDGRVLEICGG